MNGDMLRGFDTQTNLLALDGQYGHNNVGAHGDRLMGPARQYKHRYPFSSGWCVMAIVVKTIGLLARHGFLHLGVDAVGLSRPLLI